MNDNKPGMDKNPKGDRRSRKFGQVALPPDLKPVSNRLVETPELLGPLANLVGVWKGTGTGWNMIALPFQGTSAFPSPFKFRVLMNQYDEELKFVFIDEDVPNRGLSRPDAPDNDQFVVTLDYEQKIAQIDGPALPAYDGAEDRPHSGGLAGGPRLPIHHEPGLWLYERNRRAKDDQIIEDAVSEVELDVARLASIPHGNSVLAIGKSAVHKGMPEIPPLSGLPMGRFEDVLTPDYDFRDVAAPDLYLEPYRHYIEHPFMGNAGGIPGFPGFSPADMNQILRFANQELINQGFEITRTTTLTVDSTRKRAGISNVPFSVREAEPVSMKSTFWIQEVKNQKTGAMSLRLQYSQVVMLNFFHPRQDEFPGKAVWPHISIATLSKVPFDYKIQQG